MYAMQYRIALPAYYDMQIIRDRVRQTGHLLDGFAGLEFKAYLIQDRTHGATRNVYAPFYVWRHVDGMRNFCWGEPGYSAIVRDFGRHPITDWTVHQFIKGPADYAAARSLQLTEVPLPPDVAPSESLESVTHEFLRGSTADTVARVTAVDVTTWTAVLAELSSMAVEPPTAHHTSATPTSTAPTSTTPNSAASMTYEVLHVSPPAQPLAKCPHLPA